MTREKGIKNHEINFRLTAICKMAYFVDLKTCLQQIGWDISSGSGSFHMVLSLALLMTTVILKSVIFLHYKSGRKG